MNSLDIYTLLRRAVLVVICAFYITACRAEGVSPITVLVSPNASTIPANTLRLYINFSEPMARGQASRLIYLEDTEGAKLTNQFLNLNTELWNSEQTRLTLLFDPGRIKRGVGPNKKHGAPLIEGKEFSLVVNQDMKTASGEKLGAEQVTVFKIGPAERRAITPKNWIIILPQNQTRAILTIEFDRLIDAGAAANMLAIKDQLGHPKIGKASSDGKSWSFKPSEPWQSGSYEIVVPSFLEDIAGNTLHSAFDTNLGETEQRKHPISLKFTLH